MHDDEQRETDDSGGGQPAPTEGENEEATTGRLEAEDAMRAPGHENPDLPGGEQIYDE